MKTKKELERGVKGMSKPFKRSYVRKREKIVWKEWEKEYREYKLKHLG